jgi:hypothetical protein
MDKRAAQIEGRVEGAFLTAIVIGATVLISLYIFGFIW